MQIDRLDIPRSKPGVEYNDGDGVIVTGEQRQVLEMLTACALMLQEQGYDLSGVRREVVRIKKEMDARHEDL